MKDSLYASPAAFRQALETRLNRLAGEEGADIQRLRRQVAFDRLLARLFLDAPHQWLLKGGYAMELRSEESRTTRDIDLALCRPLVGDQSLADRMMRCLQAAAATDTGDFFEFAVGDPSMDLAAAPYGGSRYPVEARMAGRTFARFHLDVAAGDPVLDPLEKVQGRDWLAFAGIVPPTFTMISKEQQFAEKLHAYTLPREGITNTRVRDLLDMALLVHLGMNPDRVRKAVFAVFEKRGTHPPPKTVPSPPNDWSAPFTALAEECGMDPDIRVATGIVAQYYAKLTE